MSIITREKRVQELFIYHPDIKLLVDRVKIPFFWGGGQTFIGPFLTTSSSSLKPVCRAPCSTCCWPTVTITRLWGTVRWSQWHHQPLALCYSVCHPPVPGWPVVWRRIGENQVSVCSRVWTSSPDTSSSSPKMRKSHSGSWMRCWPKCYQVSGRNYMSSMLQNLQGSDEVQPVAEI